MNRTTSTTPNDYIDPKEIFKTACLEENSCLRPGFCAVSSPSAGVQVFLIRSSIMFREENVLYDSYLRRFTCHLVPQKFVQIRLMHSTMTIPPVYDPRASNHRRRLNFRRGSANCASFCRN